MALAHCHAAGKVSDRDQRARAGVDRRVVRATAIAPSARVQSARRRLHEAQGPRLGVERERLRVPQRGEGGGACAWLEGSPPLTARGLCAWRLPVYEASQRRGPLGTMEAGPAAATWVRIDVKSDENTGSSAPWSRMRVVVGAVRTGHLSRLPSGFTESLVADGLTNPTAMEFAPDGRLFVCRAGRAAARDQGRRAAAGAVRDAERRLERRARPARGRVRSGLRDQRVRLSSTTPRRRRTSTTASAASPPTATWRCRAARSSILDLDEPERRHQPQRRRDPLRDRRQALRRGRRQRERRATRRRLTNRLGKILRHQPERHDPDGQPVLQPRPPASTARSGRSACATRSRSRSSRAPGRIFINDVGQGTWEEINDGVAGANYGWPECEGPNVINSILRAPRRSRLRSTGTITGDPRACAVTGGAFHDPQIQQFPAEFAGTYFFADLCAGWIRRVNPGQWGHTPFVTASRSRST